MHLEDGRVMWQGNMLVCVEMRISDPAFATCVYVVPVWGLARWMANPIFKILPLAWSYVERAVISGTKAVIPAFLWLLSSIFMKRRNIVTALCLTSMCLMMQIGQKRQNGNMVAATSLRSRLPFQKHRSLHYMHFWQPCSWKLGRRTPVYLWRNLWYMSFNMASHSQQTL